MEYYRDGLLIRSSKVESFLKKLREEINKNKDIKSFTDEMERWIRDEQK
jgi:hypothetical protein